MDIKNLLFLAASAAVVCESGSGSAQAGWPFSKRSEKSASCNAPACAPPACAAPTTAPATAPTTAPAESPAPTTAPAAAPALFAAPPPSGEIVGESNSFGLRLPSITLPEMRLALPTIHMPCVVRSRRGPEMFVDGGRAPMAAGPPAMFGQLANVTTAPATAPAPAPAPASPAPAPATPPAPAPAANCVDTTSTFDANAELQETRRLLQVYRREFENLKRTVEASGVKSPQLVEEEVPPSPVPRQTSLKLRKPSRVVEAGYEEEDADNALEQPARETRAAPVPRPQAPRRPGLTGSEKVGQSYQVDDEAAADKGLGVWTGDGTRRARPAR